MYNITHKYSLTFDVSSSSKIRRQKYDDNSKNKNNPLYSKSNVNRDHDQDENGDDDNFKEDDLLFDQEEDDEEEGGQEKAAATTTSLLGETETRAKRKRANI
jgi:hypothetical protein